MKNIITNHTRVGCAHTVCCFAYPRTEASTTGGNNNTGFTDDSAAADSGSAAAGGESAITAGAFALAK